MIVLNFYRFHGIFAHKSGLRRVQNTKNETVALQDPQQVSKPKYEATAVCVRNVCTAVCRP